MNAVVSHMVHLGKLRLTNGLNDKPIKRLDSLMVQFRAHSQADYIDSRWSFKFDRNGNLIFYSTRPLLDLMREFAAEDYHLRLVLNVPSFEPKTVDIIVSQQTWSAMLLQVEMLIGGEPQIAPLTPLFDQPVTLLPVAVAAQISLSSQNALDPNDYFVRVTAPSSVVGLPLGKLAIWSLNPLPVVAQMTVTVSLVADDSVVTTAQLTPDYSQPVTILALNID